MKSVAICHGFWFVQAPPESFSVDNLVATTSEISFEENLLYKYLIESCHFFDLVIFSIYWGKSDFVSLFQKSCLSKDKDI